MPTDLLMIRHGQSVWNAERRWQGQADPPLSELGELQAIPGIPGPAGGIVAPPPMPGPAHSVALSTLGPSGPPKTA